MNEFNRGGQADVTVTTVVAQARAGQRQQRPQPFAASGDQMAGELGDQRHVRLHMVENELIDPGEIGRAEVAQRVEWCRLPGFSDARQLCDDSQWQYSCADVHARMVRPTGPQH